VGVFLDSSLAAIPKLKPTSKPSQTTIKNLDATAAWRKKGQNLSGRILQ